MFTCDPYSRILDGSDKNTPLLFGDAATVTLINESPVYVHDKSVFCTNGSAFPALVNDTGIFKMDGRAVFNFVMTEMPSQSNDLIESKNLTTDDIDIFIFHQGSKFMIENLAKKLNVSNKAPFDIVNTGNTVSSSIPLILEKYLNQPLSKVILSGFGVGLSWASSLLILNEN